MKHQYYAWHWLNVEAGDTVYYYTHGKLYEQKMLHATAYYKTIEFSSGKKETYMTYVIYETIGKRNKKSKFRFNVGTSEMEHGYGKDYNGTLRFSCIEAVKEYFEKRKKYAEWKISYYNFLIKKNKKTIEHINSLNYENV